MKKIGMLSLMGKCSTRLYSHNAGYTYCLIEMLKSRGYSVDLLAQDADLTKYDALCINNGINFKEGAWNFIGGPPKTLEALLRNLLEFNGKILTFNHRIRLFDLPNARKEFAHLKGYIWPQVETIYTEENGSNLIIGDSHSLSAYRPDWGLSRNDGKTLFGALRSGGQFIRNKISETGTVSAVHLYFGNIDIRFHLCRQSIPTVATSKLALRYLEFVKSLLVQGLDVTVQGLIPIETEDRKIPGTGLYLKKPFFGTQEKRQECVDLFNAIMQDASVEFGYTFNAWSFDTPLDTDLMESRQSVHIRPSSYYYESFRNKMK